MIEYIFMICSFNKIHDSHIKFLESMKVKSKKIILGLFEDYVLNKSFNKKNIDRYFNREKTLLKYVDEIIILDNCNPRKCFENFIIQKFFHINELDKIYIGPSNHNSKIINNVSYNDKLFFIHNYIDTFNYTINNNLLEVTRIDKKSGWGQDLCLYKLNCCFFITENHNYSDLFNYVNNIMGIKIIPSILEYDYDILEKYENMKIDWVVGWINPNNIKNFSPNHNIQRLRDNNELLYFLKSIYKYCNWINNIYIILGYNSKPPSWYNHNNSKIKLVDESSLYKNIQKNSETKKLFYGTIPNISNLFIAGDDDYLIGDYIHQSEFFTIDEKPIINSVSFGYDGFAHIPIAWNKNIYNQALISINCSYYLNMGTDRKNPWIDIKEYLIKNELAVFGNRKFPDVWIYDGNESEHHLHFQFIMKNNPKYICINDDWSKDNKYKYEIQLKDLNNFYELFLPEKYNFMK